MRPNVPLWKSCECDCPRCHQTLSEMAMEVDGISCVGGPICETYIHRCTECGTWWESFEQVYSDTDKIIMDE